MNNTTALPQQTYTDNTMTIQIKLGLTTRIIGSAMFGIFAIFFGYYLVIGLIEYIRLATLEEWLHNTLGFLFNFALVLLFAVPAWLILAGRNWVTIDKQEGLITTVRDWRLFQQTTQYDLADAKAILVITEINSHKDRSATISYKVELLVNNNKGVLLAIPDNEEMAEIKASDIATYTNLPIEYRTVRS
ncbi:MAG: hypothetical protein KDE51_12370 [Anaerolineales bacterium]|nr:hypothetical protein [Anaerolineales bacterium]